jgi:Cft2 family RNA processing exonuclease
MPCYRAAICPVAQKKVLFTGDFNYQDVGLLCKIKPKKIKINTIISQATYANIAGPSCKPT